MEEAGIIKEKKESFANFFSHLNQTGKSTYVPCTSGEIYIMCVCDCRWLVGI